jgi:hypothetical protein
MRCSYLLAMPLLLVGCSCASGPESSTDAAVTDAGGDVRDAGVDSDSGDAGGLACPASADGCNMAVGTIGGEPFAVTETCPSFGAAIQRVWLTNYGVDGSCAATAAPAPNDRALELELSGAGSPTFTTAYWYPTGHAGGARTQATSGTAVVDIWDVGANRMRGTFDLRFGADRVCGCFDAVAP